MIDSPVELLYLFEQLLYAPVLAVKLFLHLLQLALLIYAPDDLIDVELEAHVAHFFVYFTPHYLRGLNGTR